jgi:hypothetical protein
MKQFVCEKINTSFVTTKTTAYNLIRKETNLNLNLQTAFKHIPYQKQAKETNKINTVSFTESKQKHHFSETNSGNKMGWRLASDTTPK